MKENGGTSGVLSEAGEEGAGRGPSQPDLLGPPLSEGPRALAAETGGGLLGGRPRGASCTHTHTLHIPAVLCQRLGKPGLCGFGKAGTNNPQTWVRAGLGLGGRDPGEPPGSHFSAGLPGSRSGVFLHSLRPLGQQSQGEAGPAPRQAPPGPLPSTLRTTQGLRTHSTALRPGAPKHPLPQQKGSHPPRPDFFCLCPHLLCTPTPLCLCLHTIRDLDPFTPPPISLKMVISFLLAPLPLSALGPSA